MKLSIIVPVYNVKSYLKRCVESLLNQHGIEYEIILVDDGSTDGSGDLCDELSRGRDFISVYHKENGGLSDARNFGISKAKGEYLAFVDSDDYVEPDCFSEIFASVSDADESDVIVTGILEAFPDKIVNKDEEITAYCARAVEKSEALEWILVKSKASWPAQKSIVSRRFINEKGLSFRRGFLHEDIDWTTNLCIFAESFCFSDVKWYYHVMEREGSIMNVIKPKRVTDTLTIAYDFICGENRAKLDILPEKEKSLVISRLMRSVYPAIMLCGNMTRDGIKEVEKYYRQYEAMMKYTPCPKYKLFNAGCRLFGFFPCVKLAARFN